MNSRLNIHVGLRWEPFLPEIDIFNRGASYSAGAFAAGTRSGVYVNAPPGLFFVGDPGIPKGYFNHRLNDFEPRVGLPGTLPEMAGKASAHPTASATTARNYSTKLVMRRTPPSEAPSISQAPPVDFPILSLVIRGATRFHFPFRLQKLRRFRPKAPYAVTRLTCTPHTCNSGISGINARLDKAGRSRRLTLATRRPISGSAASWIPRCTSRARAAPQPAPPPATPIRGGCSSREPFNRRRATPPFSTDDGECKLQWRSLLGATPLRQQLHLPDELHLVPLFEFR